MILTRNLEETTGTGSTEKTLIGGTSIKVRPRWSCQQDMVAYGDIAANQTRIFVIKADENGYPVGIPMQVTSPGAEESDSGGHDFFDNGNKIVFSRSRPGTGSREYDLYYQNSDGTGIPTPIRPTSLMNETLPVVSHNGKLLAYREYYMHAAGWFERVVILRTGFWDQYKVFNVLPPARMGSIAALGFSGDDNKILFSAEAIDSAGTTSEDKLEIFSRDIATDNVQKRLTNNRIWDSHPDGIPRKQTTCTRCVEIEHIPSTSPSQQIMHNSVVFNAAILPSGNPTTISAEDYSSPHDGINEVKIGWSQTNAGAGEYASIRFPSAFFGDGPSEVVITAFHYNACRLEAYDMNGNMIASPKHTAGQRTPQTLSLRGGKIFRIDFIGAEIGTNEVCYRK